LWEQGQQQTPGDGQANALSLSRGGEAGEAVGIEDDGLLELSMESVPLGVEAVVVVVKLLKPLAGVRTVNGLKHFGRVAVEGLTGRSAASGLSGDGAVGSIKDSSGVGDAKRRR
jgi:hypothetical protein